MTKETKYVLITGAGSGLGRGLALELAKKGKNLLLVSLYAHELEAVKTETLGISNVLSVHILSLDLLQPDAHKTINRWVEENGYKLEGLVNNVGFGYTGRYQEMEPDFLSNLLQLNVVLLNNLTRLLVPNLIKNAPGFILNVSSMAAFFPLPYKSVYSASKAFVRSYSNSLREELRDYKINVTCVTPGPMITSQAVRDRIVNLGWRKYIVNMNEPERIAKITIDKLLRNAATIVPTRQDRALIIISKLIPWFLLPVLLRQLSKNSFK